jgi:hypothetical protein
LLQEGAPERKAGRRMVDQNKDLGKMGSQLEGSLHLTSGELWSVTCPAQYN